MITFIDAPEVEPHGDVFLITATSGGEEVKLMLTFKSVGILACRCSQALRERAEANREAASKIVAFPQKPKGRAKR